MLGLLVASEYVSSSGWEKEEASPRSPTQASLAVGAGAGRAVGRRAKVWGAGVATLAGSARTEGHCWPTWGPARKAAGRGDRRGGGVVGGKEKKEKERARTRGSGRGEARDVEASEKRMVHSG